MGRNTQFYNQANHSVVVAANDGSFSIPLKDFAEGDDVISIEPIGDRVALSQGFDKSVLSFSSTDGGQVMVKLKPTSPDVGFLDQLFNRQRTQPTLLNITIASGVDDVVVLREAGIMKESYQIGGPTAQPRGYIFIGAELDYDESQG